MSKEPSVHKTYSDFMKRFLLGCRLHPSQQNIASKCVPIFLILCYSINSFAVINFLYHHITKISVVITCFSVLNALMNSAIKTFQFLVYREKLTRVNNVLETLFLESSAQQPADSPVFQFLMPFYRLCYYQFICLILTATLFSTRPLIAMTIRHTNHLTPLPSIYPWPTDSIAIFTLHYLFEAMICCSFLMVASGVDTFFTLCAFYMSSVFRAMALELKELTNERNVMNSMRVLRRCIERHVLLIECRDAIQEIYGPVILMTTMLNTVGMCGMIFEILQETKKITIEKACTLIVYLSGKVIQTLIYAWPGDVITSESEVFQREVYCNDWFNHLDPRSMKLSCAILTQRKMIPRACNLLIVSLDLFAKIMNRTISYYFLLVTLDSKQ